MGSSQRFLIYLSYVGAHFKGSQVQKINNVLNPSSPSVQGAFENALNYYNLAGHSPVSTYFSSRTDTGVHALNAGVHVDLPSFPGGHLKPEIIQYKLNYYFKLNNIQIRVKKIQKVPDIFHARRSAQEKVYVYRLAIKKKEFRESPVIEPVAEIGRTYFVKLPNFDLSKAKEAALSFVGEKDFAAIVGNPSKNTRPTVCDIKSFTIEEAKPLMPDVDPSCHEFDYYHLTVRGNRFLYHMVRRMVGLVLAVASGKVKLSYLNYLLEKRDCSLWDNKVIVVPGYGLYLAHITFNPDHLLFVEEEKYDDTENQLLTEDVKESNKRPSYSGLRTFLDRISGA